MEARVVRPPLDRLLERGDRARIGPGSLVQQRQREEALHVPGVQPH